MSLCKSTLRKPKVVVTEAVVDNTTKIASVKQDTFTDFTVTMSKALETATAADFNMVRDDDNQVITVKSASLDATDKTKVKLTVYTSLTDAKTYTVTYTAADEAKTQSSAKVTVTDGTVADVNITPVEITANSATKIEYQTLDANGVVISQKGVTTPASNVDVTWDSLLGTMDNTKSEYILYNVGDTAKFTVTYHTYKYDATTGAETGVITKDFTVSAVKDASVISQYTYTVATYKPYDWSKVTPKQTVALDDTNRKAFFLIKDAKNSNVTGSCGYSVESSDNSIVVADGTVGDDNGVTLTPVNKGSAFLMIKDKDGKVVNTQPITVGDKRTIATFKLSAPVVSITSNASIGIDDTACGWTDMIIKDQYGDDLTPADVSIVTSKSTQTPHSNLVISTANKDICIESVSGATGKNEGSDSYILKATDSLGKEMITSLRVNTVNATGALSYSVAFLDANNRNKVTNSVDTTISEDPNDTAAQQKLTAYVVEKRNGVVVGKATGINITSMTVKKNDGSTVAKVVSSDGISKAVSGNAITPTVVSAVTGTAALASGVDTIVRTASTGSTSSTSSKKYLGVGTYQYYFELEKAGGKPDKAVANINVTDKQTAVTAKIKDTYYNSTTGNIYDVFNNSDYVEYYYGDVLLSSSEVCALTTNSEVDYKISNGNKNAYVKSVTVSIKVANSPSYMEIPVSVNRTIITTNTAWN